MDVRAWSQGPPGGSRWLSLMVCIVVGVSLPGCVTALSRRYEATGSSAGAFADRGAVPTPPLVSSGADEARPGSGRIAELQVTPLADPSVSPVAADPPPTLSATPPGPSPPVVPAGRGVYPIDLSTSLQLASSENPRIAEARTMILTALAEQQIARSLLLPTLNAGFNYHGHTGNLQRSSGTILPLSEQSLYFGGGARTLAAESLAFPAVNVFSPLTEVIYEPLAARQRVAGARFEVAATANEVLLEVTGLHLELLGTSAALEAQRLSESQAAEIAGTVTGYFETGQGRKADADRADAEWKLRRADVQRAEADVKVASARLARRLNLDPSVELSPLAGQLAPLDLIDLNVDPESLVQHAIRRRPDIAARTAGVAVAQTKTKEEIARPLLPFIWFGYSGGAFGGGSNLKPPFLSHFGGRTDFDVRAIWTLQNFGLGNLALQRRRRAEVGEAVAEQSRTINVARQEIASARAEAIAARGQINSARFELRAALEGFENDLELTRQNLVRPIEVLNSLNLLARARLNLIGAITRYNQSQFALFIALGAPPPIDPSSIHPGSPPPVATPLHAPLVDRQTHAHDPG